MIYNAFGGMLNFVLFTTHLAKEDWVKYQHDISASSQPSHY